MRAVPMLASLQVRSVHTAAAAFRSVARELEIAATPMPTALVNDSPLPSPPMGVSPFAWEMLMVNIGEARRRTAAAIVPLRESVQRVAREMRASHQTWEQVYAVLHGVVAPAPDRLVDWAVEYEMYTSRSSALVAHMQSWADVERLAELESEAHGD